jgi:mitogen-activated protein kinase kinase kinase
VENHITGDLLLECDQSILKQLGIVKIGDRIRINQSLRILREANSGLTGVKMLRDLDDSAMLSPFSASDDGDFAKGLKQPSLGSLSKFAAGSVSTSMTSLSALTPSGQTFGTSAGELLPGMGIDSSTTTQTVLARPPVTKKEILSMDVVKQNTLKFIYAQGQSKTVNIAECRTADDIKQRALRKLTEEGVSKSPSDWIVHVADNDLGTTTRQLTDLELVSICHDADRLERRRLILCPLGTSPTLKQLSKSQQIFRDSLAERRNSFSSFKAPIPESRHNGRLDRKGHDVYEDEDDETGTVFPDDIHRLRMAAARANSGITTRKHDRLSEQRPPSELISSNLAHYFPQAQETELKETIRNSIRVSKRISRISNRLSTASSVWGIPETDESIPPVPSLEEFGHDSALLPLSSAPLVNPPSANGQANEDATATLRKSILSRHSTRGSDYGGGSSMALLSNRLSTVTIAKTLTDSDDDDTEEDADAEHQSDSEFLAAIKKEESCPSRWIKGRLIGSGSFGTVYLGMNAFTGELMAVKQVELMTDENTEDQSRKKSMLDALQREMHLLKELQHENIVQYLGSNLEENFLNIFLEYVPGGSVASLLANYGVFEESLIRNFIRQILHGLNYLHGKNIIHRDIKGANVLVDNKGCIKISDFGISKKIDTKLLTSNRVSLQGSIFWMAPEVVKQTSYTSKADIWSLGCLVIEMFSGAHPFPEFTQMQAIFRLGNSGTPGIPSECSDEAKGFLSLTFAIDHNERPTASELLDHEFVQSVVPP